MSEQLQNAWQQVSDASGQGIQWIEEVRPNVARLNNEADDFIIELRRTRNLAKRLGNVSNRPMTTGFFGLSQAGKSYLISALAAGTNGKLETQFDGKTLDFIAHINPPGGGKEATGLVTRFTRQVGEKVAGYPLELRIFSEAEIAKILLNSYFNDFDKEKTTYEITPQAVSNLLKTVATQKSTTLSTGMTADDVVDLYDYAKENFSKSVSVLEGGYWIKASHLAPYLPIEARAKLFSVLWGEIQELTDIYIQFAKTLNTLGNPERVYAPLEAVVKDDGTGELSQADSIMNVDMLERLGTAKDSNIEVRPYHSEGTLGEPVPISLAQLAALTAELVFPLINETRVAAFNKVDLLDFPGYRGRLGLTSINDSVKDGTPVPQLLLRGKVSYLFERYTDSQEMNILIVCTPSDKQSEVTSVGPVLERWIYKTQGENADTRGRRKPGLLWAMTMFDKRISENLEKTENLLKQSWGSGGLLQQTILERFGKYDWLQNWSNGQPFNNVFLVRKPGFKVGFLAVENGSETAYREEAQLEKMKTTFIADADIQTYINQPSEAWDAMMALNDGGMKRISDYLQTIALPEVKETRITEQLNERIDRLLTGRFDTWYQSDGEEEAAKKRELALKVREELWRKAAFLTGELLQTLQLPEATIRTLYYSTDELSSIENDKQTSSTTTNKAEMGFGFDDFGMGDDDPFSSPSSHTEERISEKAPESHFAQAVFNAWVAHLRGLPNDDRFKQFFPIHTDQIEGLIGELITGANRLKLQEQMAAVANANEQKAQKKEEKISLQTASMFTLLADFIAWLGFMEQANRPESVMNKGEPIFAPPKVTLLSGQNKVPKLSEAKSKFTQTYLADWLVAFETFAIANAGHSAGREIDSVQNAALGQIVNAYKQAKIG